MLLRDIAHARTGDKGDRTTLSVIAFDARHYPLLEKMLTPERVRAQYPGLVLGAIDRYRLAQLGALNFVLHGALGGGVTRSLALDAHGKCLASGLLGLRLTNDEVAEARSLRVSP